MLVECGLGRRIGADDVDTAGLRVRREQETALSVDDDIADPGIGRIHELDEVDALTRRIGVDLAHQDGIDGGYAGGRLKPDIEPGVVLRHRDRVWPGTAL